MSDISDSVYTYCIYTYIMLICRSKVGVKSTYSNISDLLTSQVPQLLDEGSEQFGLLLRKLRNQLLQKRPNIRQTAARSHPNTCRDASEVEV